MSKSNDNPRLTWIIFGAILLVMGGISFGFYLMVSGKKTEPANLKLGAWNTSEAEFIFTLPPGEDYFLTLGIASLPPMTHFHEMEGEMNLYAGDALVWSVDLAESDFQQTRWLETDNGPGAGYVVNTLALDRMVSLVPGETYRLSVKAPANQIISFTELWLHYSRFEAVP